MVLLLLRLPDFQGPSRFPENPSRFPWCDSESEQDSQAQMKLNRQHRANLTQICHTLRQIHSLERRSFL
jgi:hypothetical protein